MKFINNNFIQCVFFIVSFTTNLDEICVVLINKQRIYNFYIYCSTDLERCDPYHQDNNEYLDESNHLNYEISNKYQCTICPTGNKKMCDTSQNLPELDLNNDFITINKSSEIDDSESNINVNMQLKKNLCSHLVQINA